MGMHENISPKRNRFSNWGRPLEATAPVSYILRKIFPSATLASQIVCLYLALFWSYKASEMNIGLFKNCRYNNATYLELWWMLLGATAPCHAILTRVEVIELHSWQLMLTIANCYNYVTVTEVARTRGHLSPTPKNGNKTAKINVKNFHGSLTTIVRAQNNTSKTANIN